jgi:hypothetical protein
MYRRNLCTFAICLVLGACSGGEPPAEMAETEAPAEAGSGTEPMEPDTGIVVDEAFLNHMHAHADMLDEINYALSDGDLESAITPAYWLSKHHDFRGMPEEWKPFAQGMRDAAAAVESAEDLETARAAAARIDNYCRDCHTAAGITNEYD